MKWLSCSQCGHAVARNPGDRPPAWCARCGADFQPKQEIPADFTPELFQPTPAPPPVVASPDAPSSPFGLFQPTILPTRNQWPMLALIVALAAAGPLAYRAYQAVCGVDVFNEQHAAWLQEPLARDTANPYVRGRVLPFGYIGDGHGPRVDEDLYWSLPDELRPRKPEEVGMVAQLRWENYAVTTPKRPWQIYYILGYQPVCTLTLIDRQTRVAVATMTFTGTDPTGRKPGTNEKIRGEKTYGDRPHQQILDFLKGLPPKPG